MTKSTNAYVYSGPVDCSVAPDMRQCRGKSVIITGGAQGIGEMYVRGFVKAGAFVTFCDIDEVKGKELEAELSPDKVCFVKADTRAWDEQLRMFEAAVSKSPHKSVDIVIANAGVGSGSGDPMMALEDPSATPTKPSMHIIDINLIGVMYSLKLAVHFFRRSPITADRDRCFIFGGSAAGYMDSLNSWEYSTSKFGLRGLMRTVRRQSRHQGIRVAYIAPSYVRTTIAPAANYEAARASGIDFATVESCLAAAMRISCDTTINGHTLIILPFSHAKEGFLDMDDDDLKDENHYMFKGQRSFIEAQGDEWS